MIALVAVLWLLYLSECFTRWRPGEWLFRETIGGAVRAVSGPDLTLLNERLALAWSALFPWNVVHVCAGDEVDRDRVRAMVRRLAQEGRWVRRSAAALFALLLVVVPILVVTDRLLPVLLWVAGSLGVTWLATVVSFVTAYHRVYGSRPALETWLMLALSPVDLVRAPVVLSLRALAGVHPVAAADALCGDAEFLRVARLWHFDAPGLRPAIESLATARDLGEALMAPPSRFEPGVAVFCPRCHATFTTGAAHCPDCASVDLTPLART